MNRLTQRIHHISTFSNAYDVVGAHIMAIIFFLVVIEFSLTAHGVLPKRLEEEEFALLQD
jgi:hypothetical protein